MSHKQIEDEIKYRFSCLLLDYMLEYILIPLGILLLFIIKKRLKPIIIVVLTHI